MNKNMYEIVKEKQNEEEKDANSCLNHFVLQKTKIKAYYKIG